MGRHRKIEVNLTHDERDFLQQHLKKGNWSPRVTLRARVLLLSDINGPNPRQDNEIASILSCSLVCIANIRKRWFTGGIKSIVDKPRSGRPIKFDAHVDAHATRLACSKVPEGHSRWTLSLISNQLIQLGVCDNISPETVRKTLKKNNLNLG